MYYGILYPKYEICISENIRGMHNSYIRIKIRFYSIDIRRCINILCVIAYFTDQHLTKMKWA